MLASTFQLEKYGRADPLRSQTLSARSPGELGDSRGSLSWAGASGSSVGWRRPRSFSDTGLPTVRSSPFVGQQAKCNEQEGHLTCYDAMLPITKAYWTAGSGTTVEADWPH